MSPLRADAAADVSPGGRGGAPADDDDDGNDDDDDGNDDDDDEPYSFKICAAEKVRFRVLICKCLKRPASEANRRRSAQLPKWLSAPTHT
jgi:hypothetical protein